MGLQTISTEPERALIETTLAEILSSTPFKSSRQCQELLRYIVTNTLAHHDELLRERVIGMNVFGRTPDYDTGNDPIVRSRAAEVRKRLAQHYLHAKPPIPFRIEIPSGSYKATFDQTEDAASAPPRRSDEADRLDRAPQLQSSEAAPYDTSAVATASPRKRSRGWALLIAAVLVCLSVCGIFLQRRPRGMDEHAFRQFWYPLTSSTKPVVIYIGANDSYRLTPRFLDNYRRERGLANTGPEFFIDLKPGVKIDESDLIPDNRLIGFGDVAAAGRIISTLTSLHKAYDLRYGDDISFSDLHASPALLIGGFSNPWTLAVTRNLRFSLQGGDRIVDRKDSTRVWLRKTSADGQTQDDYAVISRLPKSETGDFVLVIAGIDTYSNQGAAAFLSNPEDIASLLSSRAMPRDWQNKNIQVVLHTTAVNGVPAATNVEAVAVW